jgi:hypothetical protein
VGGCIYLKDTESRVDLLLEIKQMRGIPSTAKTNNCNLEKYYL